MTDHNDQHAPSPPVPGRLAALLDELITEIGEARAVPLSNNVMINQEDMLDRLHEAAEELPEELRAARWMVRERESYIARTNDRAQELVNKAKGESQELISENYIRIVTGGQVTYIIGAVAAWFENYGVNADGEAGMISGTRST